MAVLPMTSICNSVTGHTKTSTFRFNVHVSLNSNRDALTVGRDALIVGRGDFDN